MRSVHRSVQAAVAALAVTATWSAASHAEDAVKTGRNIAQANPAEGYVYGTPSRGEISTYEDVRPNRPMLATGLVVLGSSFATSAIVAAQSDRDSDKKLYLPVVGPWLSLANRSCDITTPCAHETRDKALLITSGVAQGLGLFATVASLFVPERRAAVTIQTGVHVTPAAIGSGYGISASGAF